MQTVLSQCSQSVHTEHFKQVTQLSPLQSIIHSMKLNSKYLAIVSTLTLLATVTAANPCHPSATRLYATGVTLAQCANHYRGDCCAYAMHFRTYSTWSRQYDGPPNPVLGHLACNFCLGQPIFPYGGHEQKILKHA